MKTTFKIIGLLLLMTEGQNLFGQTEKKFYYDKNWKICKESKAVYYRVASFDSNGKPGITKDYFITGELQWEGKLTYFDEADDKNNIWDGQCTWYYKNGKKQRVSTIINGKEDGLTTYYNDKEQIIREVEHQNGILIKNTDYYDNSNNSAHPNRVNNSQSTYNPANPNRTNNSQSTYNPADPNRANNSKPTYNPANPNRTNNSKPTYNPADPNRTNNSKPTYNPADPNRTNNSKPIYNPADPNRKK